MHDIETSIGKNTKNKKERHQSDAKAGGKSSRKNIKIFIKKKKETMIIRNRQKNIKKLPKARQNDEKNIRVNPAQDITCSGKIS